jgi:hypothetical protein
MTDDKLIAKALEHAKVARLELETLKNPKVRETVIIYFEGKLKNGSSTRKTQICLDKKTGDFIEATYHDE